ncbi:MAG: 2'-5' RNA ligase family protein [Ruminococcaceae bacterium]|nr:2'-5' RNA ligase family protein [Oscillospiraceae bacterium]
MSEKALYVLAGYDEITEMHLANIQNTLYEHGFTGTHTKNIPQHITLGSFPTEKEAELIGLLRKLSIDVPSFEITFNHIGIFGGARVLFVAPDSNDQLLKLKEMFGSSYNWTPHTTMLIDNPDTIYKALPFVMKKFSAFKGRITALHLYEFFPTRHIMSVWFEH